MAREIASWGVLPIAYLRHSLKPTEERARKACLRTMLAELDVIGGVDEAVFESRGADKDARDGKTIGAAMRAKEAPERFLFTHLNGGKDPLLWAADALASTARASMSHMDKKAFVENAATMGIKWRIVP